MGSDQPPTCEAQARNTPCRFCLPRGFELGGPTAPPGVAVNDAESGGGGQLTQLPLTIHSVGKRRRCSLAPV